MYIQKIQKIIIYLDFCIQKRLFSRLKCKKEKEPQKITAVPSLLLWHTLKQNLINALVAPEEKGNGTGTCMASDSCADS